MSILVNNIKKNYSNPMCQQCDNDICKVYGGRCEKYLRKQRCNKIVKFFKRKEKNGL